MFWPGKQEPSSAMNTIRAKRQCDPDHVPREIHADAYLMIDGDDTYPAEYARQNGSDLVLNDKGGHGHRRPPFFHLF